MGYGPPTTSQAEVAKQRDAAVEFLAEAERTNDAAALCVAHRLVGTTYVRMGEFAAGLRHLKLARALYDPKHHAGYITNMVRTLGLSTVLSELGIVAPRIR